jgi:ankyrin repeat protein
LELAPWANKACLNHAVASKLSTVYPYLEKFRQLNYQDFLFRVAKRHPNTCSWLIEDPCFVQWRNTASFTYFWLHGYPGQGKSVLARYTLERLRGADRAQFNRSDAQERANALVCYFFCSDDDARAKSSTSLVASLIHQLLCEVPSLVEIFRNSPYAEITSEISKSIWDLWKIFVLLLEGLDTRPLYIVIDALDKLEKSEWEPFFKGIEQTVRPELKRIKIFFTSRTEPELEKIFSSWDMVHLKLDDSAESHKDRDLFIQEIVNEYAFENCFEEGMNEIISSNIIAHAKGSFLWASLAWAHFKDGIGSWTKDLIHQRLKELRQLLPGMESLYHRLLYSVDERLHAELLHVLQWIVAARRPLNIKQMSVALALAEKPLCSKDMNVKLSLKEFLRRACPHLIQVDDREIVTLVHPSFKTFLLQKSHSNLTQEGEYHKFHVDLKQVDTQLGRDCMWYMGFEDSWSEEIQLERLPMTEEPSTDLEAEYILYENPSSLQTRGLMLRHPFIAYASTYWSSHIRGSDDDPQFYQAFKRVLNRQLNYLLFCFFIYHKLTHKAPLFLAAQYELSGLMKNLILDGHDINATHGGCHIIHYSSTPEHLQELLRLGADINGRDENGQTMFLRLLRKVSRRNEIPRRYRRISFGTGWDTKAINEGSSWNQREFEDSEDLEDPEDFKEYHLNEVKKALCNLAVDINASDQRGLTPVHAVIFHDGPHASDLLDMLMTRQDLYLNPVDELGRTPLTLAIHWGRESMTRKLLSTPGVNIENEGAQGENPLINAIRQGWTDLVLSLLDRLNEIGRFADNNGRNVLHWAIIVGMMNAFELALKKDRNLLTVPDRQGMTPLHYSAQEGEYRATRILLSLGASSTDKEVFGQTPLHLAAAKGHIRILKALIAYLPTPSAVNEKDSMGWTALHRAVASGNDVLVKYLVTLENVDLSKVDRHGRAAIAFAASSSSLATLNILLGARARDSKAILGQADIFCVDAYGNSLLHLAARASNKSTLGYLVTKIPRLGNRPNKWGRTARDLISPELCLPSFQLKLHTYGLQNSARFSRLRPHCCLDENIYGQPERPVHLDWTMIVSETPGRPAEEKTDEKIVEEIVEETVEETVADFSHNGHQPSSSFPTAHVYSEPLFSGSRLHQDTALKSEAMTGLFGQGNRVFVPRYPADHVFPGPLFPGPRLHQDTASKTEAMTGLFGQGNRVFVPRYPADHVFPGPLFPGPRLHQDTASKTEAMTGLFGKGNPSVIPPFSVDQIHSNPMLRRPKPYPNTARQQEADSGLPGRGPQAFVPPVSVDEICFDPRPPQPRPREAKQTFINPFSTGQFNPRLTGHPE